MDNSFQHKSIFQQNIWVSIFALTAAVVWGWAYPLIKMGFAEFGIQSSMTGSKMLFCRHTLLFLRTNHSAVGQKDETLIPHEESIGMGAVSDLFPSEYHTALCLLLLGTIVQCRLPSRHLQCSQRLCRSDICRTVL